MKDLTPPNFDLFWHVVALKICIFTASGVTRTRQWIGYVVGFMAQRMVESRESS
jgi:hypothetical protein